MKMPSMKETIKIDHNIAIPTRVVRRLGSTWPWKQLKVGDSFFMPGPLTSPAAYQRLRTARLIMHHKYRAKGENGGFRVWRIE